MEYKGNINGNIFIGTGLIGKLIVINRKWKLIVINSD